MDANKNKETMRGTLRKLRADYVTQRGQTLENEYAKLARSADALLTLHALTNSELALGSHDRLTNKLVIASFKPQHSEINPKYLEEALMLRGHRIVWPRVEGSHLRFFSNDDLPAFVKGAYGLLEPGPNASEASPDIVLLPLIGFDSDGNRLGQGGGFYDRTLQNLSANVLAIGIAWGCQQVPQIPVEAHDVPLAGVIVPGEFHRF